MSNRSARTRTINVVSASRSKHLFQVLAGSDILCRRAEQVRKFTPDIIVISLHTPEKALNEARTSLPGEVWARAAAGEAVVVFDGSAEGVVHSKARTAMLHGFLRDVGVEPRRAAYVTQDRTYRADYEAHCARQGLSAPMSVLIYDYFIKRFFQAREKDGDAEFARRLAAFEARPPRRERSFICLNRAPRHNKLFLLLSLIRDGLWDRGFISFSGFDKGANPYAKSSTFLGGKMLATPGFEDLAAELAPLMEALNAKGPIVLGELEGGDITDLLNAAVLHDMALTEREQSWFTVVNETEFSGPWRITEKPFKSLVNFHPTIIMGNARALELIRELGFETYDGYFDESYDAEPDPRRRFDMVYGEIRRLCALPDERLHALEREFAEVLTFNARWGLTRLPAVFRDQIDVKLLDDILRLID